MATTYSFKGTADFSQHDAAIRKAGQEVDKYKEKCKGASEEARRMGNQDFTGAYRSQAKMEQGVKGFTNAMNGASRGLTGMIGKAGIWGAAIAGAIMVGKKALDGLANHSDRLKDQMNRDTAEIKAGWDVFLNSLANWDFTNFFSRLNAAKNSARELADLLDQQDTFKSISNVRLKQLQNEFEEQMLQLDTLRSQYKVAQKQKDKGREARLETEMAHVKNKLQSILENINKHYIKQERLAMEAGKEAAKGYGFKDAMNMLPKNVRAQMGGMMMGISHTGSNSLEVALAEFGKYLASGDGGNPEWTDRQALLYRIFDNLNKMYTIQNGNIIELKKFMVWKNGRQVEVNGAANTGRQGLKGSEWDALQEEVFQALSELFNLGDVGLGKDGRGKAAQMIDGLVRFSHALQQSIDRMESDDDGVFTQKLTEAAEIKAAYLSNLSRFNQIDNRTNVTTAPSGPQYTQGMVGWYEKQIADLQALQKKATSNEQYDGYEKRIKEYQRMIDEIMLGESTSTYIEKRIKQIKEEFAQTPGTKEGKEANFNEIQGLHRILTQNIKDIYGDDSIQYLQTVIGQIQEEIGMAVDGAALNELQQRLNDYKFRLNSVVNSNNELARVQGEISLWNDMLKTSSQREIPGITDEINRLNHTLNGLQNRRGSLSWLQQEINLLNNEISQLDPARDMARIEFLVKLLTNMQMQYAQLQHITQSPIEIKVMTNIDKLELQIQRINSVGNACNDMANSLGDSFGYLGEIIQGGKDWDELTESQQKTIETFNKLGEVLNRLGNTFSTIANLFSTMAEADIAAIHAANTIAIDGEATAQTNLNMQKAIGASLSTTTAATEAAEAPTHVENAAALGVETTAATANAVAKSKGAVAEVAEGAAKSAPFPANLAVMAAAIAAAVALLGTIASVAGLFANGGIVGGSSYYGDHQIARVNSGEMILNKRQQANMFNLLNGSTGGFGGNAGGVVDFHIRGTELVGVLKNYESRMKRIS